MAASPDGRPRRVVGVLAVCVVVLLSACVTANVDSRVGDEDTIDLYVMEITMVNVVYNATAQELRNEGYDAERPYRDALLTDLDVFGGQVDDVEYEEFSEQNDTQTRIVLTLIDFSPSDDGNVTLREVEGDLVYEDRMMTNETALGRQALTRTNISVTYSLTMPYNITRSNADIVVGPTAEWNRTVTSDPFVFRAASRIPVPPEAAFTVAPDEADRRVGEPITFDASESTDDIGVTSYEWSFGDGETTTGEVVSHQYAEPGEYVVELRVTDEDGLSSTRQETLVIEALTTEPAQGETGTAVQTPDDSGGLPWGWIIGGLVVLALVLGAAYFLLRDDDEEDPTPPPTPHDGPPWSGLVIDDVRKEGGTTDLVVRNTGETRWSAAGKSIEDARGNRTPLPEAVSIGPGRSETLRFDRGDEEAFESAPGETVLLHTDEGERTVLWEEPDE